jgi:hypothetical protein
MRLPALLCALALLACAAPDLRPAPVMEVRVGIGTGLATGYDDLIREGLRILRPTGWRWVLVPRGALADEVIEHRAYRTCADGAGEHAPGERRVYVDPVCASGALPSIVAHELLHAVGCQHLPGVRALLAPEVIWEQAPCDPFAEVCPGALPLAEMTPADVAEFRRATSHLR